VHNNGKIIFSGDAKSFDTQKSVRVKNGNGSEVFLLIDNAPYKYLKSHKIIKLGEVVYVNPNYKFCRHLIDFGKTMLDKIERDLSLRDIKETSEMFKNMGNSKSIPDA